jgi:hypothetical protein
MPSRHRSYGAEYRAARRRVLVGDPVCGFGCGQPATTADHRPALATHCHLEGTGCCELVPACAACNAHHGAMLGNEIRYAGARLRRGGGWSAC